MAACNTVKFPVFIDCNGVGDNQISIEYEDFPTKGEISISTSTTPAIIPLATDTNAGLMSPAQFALLSKTDISTVITTGFSVATIVGSNKSGTLTLQVGSSGQSGVIFTYDISDDVANGSVLVFSDALDNYAMGHYQVAYITLDNLKKMVLTAKAGIVLEASTTYKWNYQIN